MSYESYIGPALGNLLRSRQGRMSGWEAILSGLLEGLGPAIAAYQRGKQQQFDNALATRHADQQEQYLKLALQDRQRAEADRQAQDTVSAQKYLDVAAPRGWSFQPPVEGPVFGAQSAFASPASVQDANDPSTLVGHVARLFGVSPDALQYPSSNGFLGEAYTKWAKDNALQQDRQADNQRQSARDAETLRHNRVVEGQGQERLGNHDQKPIPEALVVALAREDPNYASAEKLYEARMKAASGLGTYEADAGDQRSNIAEAQRIAAILAQKRADLRAKLEFQRDYGQGGQQAQAAPAPPPQQNPDGHVKTERPLPGGGKKTIITPVASHDQNVVHWTMMNGVPVRVD